MEHMAIGRLCLVGGLWVVTACGPGLSKEDSAGDTSGQTNAPIVGTWVGYADDAFFSSGSDRVELQVTGVDGDGQISGTIAFGEPGMIPPATDPDVGYPPGQDAEIGQVRIVEMFAYTLSGSYDDALSRLDAEIDGGEVWVDWCSLQTSYLWSEDVYSCLPNCGFGSDGTGCTLNNCELAGPVDCVKLALCNPPRVCMCDAAGCNNRSGPAFALDLHRDGDELQGPIDTLGTAFLTRQ